VKLTVIARQKDELTFSDILLRETTTLGVRVKPIWRHEAEREMRTVETRFGPISVKVKLIDGAVWQAIPEFDACAHAANEKGVPVAVVLQEASAACQSLWRSHLSETR
jgi:hypothetical protein